MTADEAEMVFAFEDDLIEGSPVEVRWTSGGARYRATASVVKRNAQSVRVVLDEPVMSPFEIRVVYPKGHYITVPLLMGTGWSALARVEPRGGYPKAKGTL